MTAIVQQVQEKVEALRQVPAVAHVFRMNTRYVTRLGNQFAGAITYFSLLAMVPILMFAFSACGFTLTVLRPDVLERVQAAIMVQLQGAPEDPKAQLTSLIGGLLNNWASVGLVGLFSSMYSSAGWVMFVYLYKVLPEDKFSFRIIAWGALIGSVGLFVLQYLTGFLMGMFSGNPAAAAFGPVIVLMLFFNLFARLSLYVAAWIATSVQPAVADQIQEFDRPLLKAFSVSDLVRREVRAGLDDAAKTDK